VLLGQCSLQRLWFGGYNGFGGFAAGAPSSRGAAAKLERKGWQRRPRKSGAETPEWDAVPRLRKEAE